MTGTEIMRGSVWALVIPSARGAGSRMLLKYVAGIALGRYTAAVSEGFVKMPSRVLRSG